MELEYVGSALPVAPWLGGKSKLAKTIIERIERFSHHTYVEPFAGMGRVFLRRSYRPKCEVMNDLNGEITNLFRILQRHYPQFMDMLKFQVTSRREFERLRQQDPSTLTDLERAARFIYLQRLGFGGKIDGVFGVATGRSARFDISRIGTLLEAAHERLAGVTLENLEWQNVVARYDSAGTLFYLDPPYFGGENDYGKGMFCRDSYNDMAEVLDRLKGEFVLSINDTSETREIFGRFCIDDVRLSYTVGRRGGAAKVSELLVSKEPVPTGLL